MAKPTRPEQSAAAVENADSTAVDNGRVGHEERVRDGYYVYGLIDPAALRDTGGDRLQSIFYVGKGVGLRWAAHENDVRNALVREQDRLVERLGSKDERIHAILDTGHHVPAVLLSAGYLDSADAFQAESLAIDTIGALLAASGRPPLTNSAPGHHAGFLWLREHFVYTQTTEHDLGPVSSKSDLPRPALADGATPGGTTVPVATRTEILVKGSKDDLPEFGQRRGDQSLLPAPVAAMGNRVTVIDLLGADHPDVRTRRGWDPLHPWTDLEARDRARRYWPIAAHRVAGWLTDRATLPTSLLLGIEEPGGRTVVRYAWSVDHHQPWEYYPTSQRWAVPLGERLHDHPRLGAALYENRAGRRVQVLTNHISGFRVLPA